jgi:hypothetical protein
MRSRLLAVLAVAALAVALLVGLTGSASGDWPDHHSTTFKIKIAKGVIDRPATGRAYVIVSRDGSDEPRFQLDVTGVPFFGKDVRGVRSGRVITIGSGPGVYGYPLESIRDLPKGEYWVQAFFNVYTKFERADGSRVWLHMPGGDGQDPFSSPGNLYSTPVKVRLDPWRHHSVRLVLDQVIQPEDPVPPGGTTQQGNPAESAHVKHVKIKSQLLSDYWGTDMYIAADVLLPEGYDASTDTYPVVYLHGHYPSGNPYGFREDLGNSFSQWWVAPDTPRMIVVQFRHENPYYDDSYAVNSANLGPYGDAITQELMPALDAQFRTINERWARALTGGSTGGWEGLAQLIFYPGLYVGAWVRAPDSVDFRSHQLVNVYEDANAYFNQSEWVDVPRPASRTVPGDTRWTMEEENHFELALGTHGRSGWGQWDIWQAVFGPQGPDGYPAPIWDKQTGEIDHTVAEAWKAMDLRLYLEANWATVGPQVAGRIHVYQGDDDNFFLNNAVELLEQHLQATTDPAADAEFVYGHNQGHGWWPVTMPELLTMIYGEMHP